MRSLRLTPRFARALRAWLACLVLGVAAAPASGSAQLDRVVMVSEATDGAAAQAAQPRTGGAEAAVSVPMRAPWRASRARPARAWAQPPHAPSTSLYLQHCALLL